MRALEFARLARNPSARAHLRLLLALSPDLDSIPPIDLADDHTSREEVQDGRG
jgi:hypothetical protein